MPGLHPRIGNGFQSSKGSNPTVCLPESIEPRRRKKRPAEILSQQVYPGMVVEVHLEVIHLFRSVFTLTLWKPCWGRNTEQWTCLGRKIFFEIEALLTQSFLVVFSSQIRLVDFFPRSIVFWLGWVASLSTGSSVKFSCDFSWFES